MKADVHIEIGKTDGFHYLGVQPPSAMHSVDVKQLELPDDAYVTSISTINLGKENAYSDVGYDSRALPPERADEAAVKTAHQLAAMIAEAAQLNVLVRPNVQQIGLGKYLFNIGKD